MAQTLFKTKLKNGLTILVQPLPNLASVSVGMSISVGSRDETSEEAGLSHLIEHMLFQGTPRRDTKELSRVISAVGGNLDACTGRESTAYYTKVPAQHFSLAVDVLADMLFHSKMTTASLEKEKQIILEEIRMYEDAPDELVHDLLFQAFWPKHTLGCSILGNRKNLLGITRKAIFRFMRKHYCPKKMILSVAGNVTPQQVTRVAKKYFGQGWDYDPAGDTPGAAPIAEFKTLFVNRKLEQAHVCFGTQGLAFSNTRRVVAGALSNILGSNPNSRLFYNVREEKGLAYSIYSFMDFYRDTGMAGVYFACHPKKVHETLDVVKKQLKLFSRRGCTLQEVKDVKEQMRGNYLIALESSSTHMWNMIQQEMYVQKHPSQSAILRAISTITQEDIHQLARDLFQQQAVASAFIGPLPKHVHQNFKILD